MSAARDSGGGSDERKSSPESDVGSSSDAVRSTICGIFILAPEAAAPPDSSPTAGAYFTASSDPSAIPDPSIILLVKDWAIGLVLHDPSPSPSFHPFWASKAYPRFPGPSLVRKGGVNFESFDPGRGGGARERISARDDEEEAEDAAADD